MALSGQLILYLARHQGSIQGLLASAYFDTENPKPLIKNFCIKMGADVATRGPQHAFMDVLAGLQKFIGQNVASAVIFKICSKRTVHDESVNKPERWVLKGLWQPAHYGKIIALP